MAKVVELPTKKVKQLLLFFFFVENRQSIVSLCRAVCANDVLNHVIVWIQERVSLSPEPNPFVIFISESECERKHLVLLLENCEEGFPEIRRYTILTTYLGQSSLSCCSDHRDGKNRNSSCLINPLECNRADSSLVDQRTKTFLQLCAER